MKNKEEKKSEIVDIRIWYELETLQLRVCGQNYVYSARSFNVSSHNTAVCSVGAAESEAERYGV